MWLDIVRKICCAICHFKEARPKNYPLYQIGWHRLVSNLGELGLELMLKDKYAPDTTIGYTDKQSWAEIVPFLTYPADDYIAEIADCDNYAMWAASDASRIFKRNGCRQCWGDTPLGYHAFGLVMTGSQSYKLFEPNAGFPFAGKLFDAGDNGYIPKAWK